MCLKKAAGWEKWELHSPTILIFVSPSPRKLILWVQSFPCIARLKKKKTKKTFADKYIEMSLKLSSHFLLLTSSWKEILFVLKDFSRQQIMCGAVSSV